MVTPETVTAFDAIADAQPEAVAIEAGDVVWTYANLQDASRALARRLQSAGVRIGDVVGIDLGRSASHAVAMLASWRIGAAFLPIHPAAPAVRTGTMLAEVKARVRLTRANGAIELNALDTANPTASTAAALAYVIYTSGSTGRPKGVRLAHEGLTAVLSAQIHAFGLVPGKRALLYLSTAFDASISDIGTALLSGATLVIPATLPGSPQLAAYLGEQRITHADLPPSLLPLVDPRTLPRSLETVIIGGEVCPQRSVRAWAERVRVVNVYGPTEATICSSLCVCEPSTWDRPLIGSPLDHVDYCVVDGELLIGGIAVALGYVDRPALEAQKFVMRDGVRWYRTGDLVRGDDVQALEFAGRIDRQIKVRGRLIAPEEIEAALLATEQAREVAVTASVITGPSGIQRTALTAWIVLFDENGLSSRQLRSRLAERLPAWMLPRLVIVRELPRGPTGKVAATSLRRVDVPPSSSTLAGLFAEVLGVDRVGDQDDFFDLGGDSLAAFEVAAAAQAAGMTVDPAAVVRLRTPAAIRAETESGGRSLADLHREADRLGVDIEPDKTPAPGARDWLLTGATGFLGRRLLTELLSRTDGTVHCLVRASSDAEARDRIGLYHERVVAWAADITQPYLGLPLARWRELTRTVGEVVHGAAIVNMALPYEDLVDANVGGTVEIVRFVRTGARKRFHFISSLAVLVATDSPLTVFGESSEPNAGARVFGGYAQTKVVAERVVRNAIPDATILRPGLLTGDSRTGLSAVSCPLISFLRGVAALGCLPIGDHARLRLDITPIDYAAAVIADVFTSVEAPAKLHVASERGASLADLVRILRRHHHVELVPGKEFLDRASLALPHDSARAVVSSAYRLLGEAGHRGSDLFLLTDRTLDCSAARRLTRRACPPIDDALLSTYVDTALRGFA